MAPVILAGLITAIGSLISGLYNTYQIRKTNDENVESTKAINQQNLDWQKELQAYNTPAEQMKRYQEAGINPLAVIGQTPSTYSGNLNLQTPIKQPEQFDMSSIFQNLGSMGQTMLTNEKIKQEEISTEKMTATKLTDIAQSYELLKKIGIENAETEKKIQLLQENIIDKELQNEFASKTLNERVLQVTQDLKNTELAGKLQATALKIQEIELNYTKAFKNQQFKKAEIEAQKLLQEISNLQSTKRNLTEQGDILAIDKTTAAIQLQMLELITNNYKSMNEIVNPELLRTIAPFITPLVKMAR